MQQYLDLLERVKDEGVDKGDRTGTGTQSIFGHMMHFDLNNGFPLVTTKKTNLKSIIHELLWIVNGSTNIRYLVENNVKIWNEWPLKRYILETTNDLDGLRPGSEVYKAAIYKHESYFLTQIISNDDFSKKWGDLGPVYGSQWRSWECPNGEKIDQLQNAIDEIQNNPTSRRIIVNAWNPADIEEMAKAGLPPCHLEFQFGVAEGKLSCAMLQRSADVFLGVPFNIASYALLTMMVAQVCDLKLGSLVHFLVDAHIYTNHQEQTDLQLTREPHRLPMMRINPDVRHIDQFTFDDFTLEGYDAHPHISGDVAI